MKKIISGWVFIASDFCRGEEIYFSKGIWLNYDEALEELIKINTPDILKRLEEEPDAYLDDNDTPMTNPAAICKRFYVGDNTCDDLFWLDNYVFPIYE